MKIQERYRKPVEEFVRRALERYGDKIDILLGYGQLLSIKIIYPQEYLGMVNIGSSFIQNIKKEGVAIG